MAVPAAAQYFGRNQVSWTRFDWRVLRTDHFEVTFYPEEEAAAAALARRAEWWRAQLVARFGVEPPDRATLIVYADLSDYQEAIATGDRLSRVAGDPIEPIGDRLVFPFSGDPRRDEYLLGHQVVHLFEAELERRRRHRQPVRAALHWPPVPLWLREGLAEYLSRGPDSVPAAMRLRDSLARRDLPALARIGRLPRDAAYAWGHALWAFVAGKYGEAAVVTLYGRLVEVGLGEAVRQVLGSSEEQVERDWQAAITEAFGPTLAARGQAARVAATGGAGGAAAAAAVLPDGGGIGQRLVPRQGRTRDEALAPALSPDGETVAFLSTRGLYGVDLYLAEAHTGEATRQLVSTASVAHFESLRYLDSAVAWSPDGRRIALVEFAHGADRVSVLDVATGRVERQLALPGAGALADPAWSPDGRRLALVGNHAGNSRIFLLDLQNGAVRPLTPEGESDLQPAWSPDGRQLAFTSDREPVAVGAAAPGGMSATEMPATADRLRRRRRIWVLDVGVEPGQGGVGNAGGAGAPGGEVAGERLAVRLPPGTAGSEIRPAAGDWTVGGADEIDPCYSPTGRDLYFVADREGINDVYRLDLSTARLYQVTRAATGVAGTTRLSPALSVAARSGLLAFTVFADSTFEIRTLEPAQARGVPVAPETMGRRASLLPPAEAAPARNAATAATAASAATASSAATAATAASAAPLAAGAAPGVAPGSTPASQPAAGAPADSTLVGYHSSLALEDVSPGVGVAYSSLGYAVGGDISVRLGDAVDRYQVTADLQGGVSAFPEFGGQVSFLDQSHRLQWGGSIGYVPSVSGFARVTDMAEPGHAAPQLTIDQIFELVDQRQAALLLQYPFSPTWRLQGNLTYSRLAFSAKDVRQALVASEVVSTSRFDLPPPAPLDLVQGSLALVGDSTVLGATSPVRGQRYRFEVALTGGDLRFEQITADYRRYFYFRPLTLAVRGLHLGRYGLDADSDRLIPLYIGDATLVRGYDLATLSASECTPSAHAPSSCPEFDRLVGSRLAVVNVELRLPLLGKDSSGVFEFRYLPTEIAVFFDAGSAWSAHQTPALHFVSNSPDRVPVASTGVAARFLLAGVAVAQVYVAKPFQRPDRNAVVGLVISPGW